MQQGMVMLQVEWICMWMPTSIKKVCTLLNTVLGDKLISKLESFKTLKWNLWTEKKSYLLMKSPVGYSLDLAAYKLL